MSQTVGQSTYYDFKELRKLARELASGKATKAPKGRLVRYDLRVSNNGASVIAHVELPSGFIAERGILL